MSMQTEAEAWQAEQKSNLHFVPSNNPSSEPVPPVPIPVAIPTAGMNEIETFYGLIESTADALRVFELCRQGRLGRVRRRLHDRERRLIRSGSVFVFDEEESGIKRWTDGRLWSPSRILGNFLIYRELEQKSMPTRSTGEHASAMCAGEGEGEQEEERTPSAIWLGEAWLEEPQPSSTTTNPLANLANRHHRPPGSPSSALGPEGLTQLKSRKLANNHKGRYVFKPGGLIKKTISCRLEGNHSHHLVCYYSQQDFCRGHLSGVFDGQLMAELRAVRISPELATQPHFRKPSLLPSSPPTISSHGKRLLPALPPRQTRPRRHSLGGPPLATSVSPMTPRPQTLFNAFCPPPPSADQGLPGHVSDGLAMSALDLEQTWEALSGLFASAVSNGSEGSTTMGSCQDPMLGQDPVLEHLLDEI